MKIFFILFLFTFSYFGQNKEKDAIKFRKGNGLRDTYIWLNGNGTIRTYFFCDICSGKDSYGTYHQKEDTIFIKDTIFYTYEPHFSNPTDTTKVIETYNYIYFMGKINNTRYLYYDVEEFKKFKKYKELSLMSDEKMLNHYINEMFYREITE